MNKIGIIGLGYVGLPLAVEFSRKYPVVGYDISEKRIEELLSGYDKTGEVQEKELTGAQRVDSSTGLVLTSDKSKLRECNVYIVTVPTPIDGNKNPDLMPLKKASQLVGEMLSVGDLVIFESTVYPGCTEEICVPILETSSGLNFNRDFFVGYSPERINPGDKINTLTKIVKVTSGSTSESAIKIDELYKSIIEAGTFRASSIKVAEASKAIENAQRDLNISFVNELSLIFDRIGIDTNEVIEAAGTKWNFLKFKPGLVGGHCISVDPYYLAYKANQLGYYPQVILSGRRVNDYMPSFVANKLIKLMIAKSISIKNAKVLVLGITFKENCPDIRNSKVIEIIDELKQFQLDVDVFDPLADKGEVLKSFNLNLINHPLKKAYSGIIIAVPHNDFKEFNFRSLANSENVLFDLKGMLPINLSDARL